jgi:4-hydroxy-3-polyprenylbenzoate decarboxylase
VHDINDVGACISSGSFKTAGMVIAPCSIKTLSALANSFNTNLLIRAADVCLKERRKTVLMLRETPLHLGHLRLMSQVTEAGAVLVPPLPAFYHRPKTLEDIIDQSVNKALDQFDLGVELNLFKRWTGNEEREKRPSLRDACRHHHTGGPALYRARRGCRVHMRWTWVANTSFVTSWVTRSIPAP